ncbi:MAG TPA: cobalt ABC transporter ATP-binding protein [Planctomycetes bacterium]|nr:cobalt ABC transporter ATP-binding protein [Planctomycetota bacterium]
MLDVRDLGYSYPDGTPALAGISLRIAAGERVAILGANGAGKSTLLLHLNGLLSGSGSVSVDGVRVAAATVAGIRQRVGFVFQDPDDQLFCSSVGEDVAFGPRQARLPEAEVRERTAEALATMGISDLAHRHPHQLSLGQKKRAAIATALAMRPAVLVLDEPSASLDPRMRRELIAYLAALSCTLVVASHDLALVRELCGRAVILDAGRIAADAPTQAILADAALLARTGLV